MVSPKRKERGAGLLREALVDTTKGPAKDGLLVNGYNLVAF
jgi:hypothetical protein